MIVLGLDAGLADFGWAVIAGSEGIAPRIAAAGAWKTKVAKGTIKAADRLRRSRELARGLADVLAEYTPTHVAVESAIVGGKGGVVAAVSSGYAAGLVAACIEVAPRQPIVVHYQPRDWRRIVLGEIGEDGEAEAHRAIRSVFADAGGAHLAILTAGKRVHATDAAGIALATYRKHRR